MNLRPLKRGQAEIIGGLIVVSVLLMVIMPLIINLMTSSTVVSTRVFSIRSQFEIDRWSEELRLINDGGVYKLSNVGSVDIDVIRVWYSNGSVVQFGNGVKIPRGASTPLSNFGVSDYQDIDRIVTARGRVFKVEELLPPPQVAPQQCPPLGLTSESVIAGYNLMDLPKRRNITITASYFDGDKWVTDNVFPAFYVYCGGSAQCDGWDQGWYIFNNTIRNWTKIPKTDEAGYADLDGNSAYELVLLKKEKEYYSVVSVSLTATRSYGQFNITIGNFTELSNQPSLIAIYLKALIAFTAQADALSSVKVVLTKSDNPLINISSYAVLSSVKVPGSDINVTIYEGYVMLPVTQFYTFSRITPGIYNLSVIVSVSAQEKTGVYLGIEYLAVVAY